MDFKNYYKVLGLEPGADDKAVKAAYRKLARKYHPDVSKETDAENKFKEVAEAYEVLKSALSTMSCANTPSKAAPSSRHLVGNSQAMRVFPRVAERTVSIPSFSSRYLVARVVSRTLATIARGAARTLKWNWRCDSKRPWQKRARPSASNCRSTAPTASPCLP
jgi:hypothetical protein